MWYFVAYGKEYRVGIWAWQLLSFVASYMFLTWMTISIFPKESYTYISQLYIQSWIIR